MSDGKKKMGGPPARAHARGWKKECFSLSSLFPLTDRPAEVLHQHRCLLNLRAVDFRRDERAEGDAGAQLLGDAQGEGGLAGAGGAWERRERGVEGSAGLSERGEGKKKRGG